VALLSFPSNPISGQLYPAAPLPGQIQYQWEAATQTWRLEGVSTGVAPGTYGDVNNIPQITIDPQGRITVASSVPLNKTYIKTNNSFAFNNYVWPSGDGTSGKVLSTDGAGALSWKSTVTVVAVPASSGAAGAAGQVASDNAYFYWWAGGSWQRVAKDTTPW